MYQFWSSVTLFYRGRGDLCCRTRYFFCCRSSWAQAKEDKVEGLEIVCNMGHWHSKGSLKHVYCIYAKPTRHEQDRFLFVGLLLSRFSTVASVLSKTEKPVTQKINVY